MSKTKITEVMMDDKTIDASKEIAMVFSIANTLRVLISRISTKMLLFQ